MNYEFNRILELIKGEFVCELNGKTEKFTSVEDFKNSDFEKSCKVCSISQKDGTLVLELVRVPSVAELNEKFVKDHIERYGVAPNLFDGV